MVELVEATQITLRQAEPPPLTLENLRIGIERVNTGHSLPGIIRFLKELGANVSIITRIKGRNAKHMRPMDIILSTHSKELAREVEGWRSSILIAGALKNPRFKGKQGEKLVMSAVKFIAVLPSDIEGLKTNPENMAIELFTQDSRNKMRALIKKTIGKMPPNWHFERS